MQVVVVVEDVGTVDVDVVSVSSTSTGHVHCMHSQPGRGDRTYPLGPAGTVVVVVEDVDVV